MKVYYMWGSLEILSEIMDLQKKIQALDELGRYLLEGSQDLDDIIQKSYQHNPWFTPENIKMALNGIAANYLDKSKLSDWLSKYKMGEDANKRVGLIMAGNIPLVGFHDFICVFLSGNISLIKLSSKDQFLFPFIAKKLIELAPEVKDKIVFIDRLENFDAVIATGSNNSARYFEQYFAKYPHIIRKNRNSAAVLTGNETKEELQQLGHDIFDYFGLGCRNVSKLYVPKDYQFITLLEALESFKDISQHNKYKNNFDYNLTLLLMNNTPHYASDFLMVYENKSLSSPIAALYYEEYEDLKKLEKLLESQKELLQCIVSKDSSIKDTIPLGASQQPQLWDYADNVDVMEFLTD